VLEIHSSTSPPSFQRPPLYTTKIPLSSKNYKTRRLQNVSRRERAGEGKIDHGLAIIVAQAPKSAPASGLAQRKHFQVSLTLRV